MSVSGWMRELCRVTWQTPDLVTTHVLRRSALQSTISLHEYDRVGSQTAANILSVEDNRVNRKYYFEVRRRSPANSCVTFSESLWQTATATATYTNHTHRTKPTILLCIFFRIRCARTLSCARLHG